MNELVSKKIHDFFIQFKHKLYKKGEILIRADDDPHGIFYLEKGIVKKYAISKKGDELILNIFKPASFFPMSWAINSTSNNYYYEAVSNLEVRRAPKEEVIQFVRENADVLYDLLSRVYKGTDGMEMRMAYLMSGNAYERLAAELLIHAKRFGRNIKNRSFEVTVTERNLAAECGMTRETVSREIKIMKNKALVKFDNNILTIFDAGKLEEELLNP